MSRIVGCCVVLLSVLVSVLSQASTTVRGTVTDSTGGIIPGASVTVIHETTDEATTRLTDETGNYAFTGLPPGIYTLTADVPGFEVGTYSNVELAAGQEVLRNFTLEISAVDTLVVVGSRAGARTATESTVPVDVIAGGSIPAMIRGEQVLITRDLRVQGKRWVRGDIRLPRALIPPFPPIISIKECQEAIEISGAISITLRGEEMRITEIATRNIRRWVYGDIRFTPKEKELLTEQARAIIADKDRTGQWGGYKPAPNPRIVVLGFPRIQHIEPFFLGGI